MDVKNYCKNVDMELTIWKAKLYDVMSKIEKLPTGDKQKMYENINGLQIVMTELDDRIESLRTECPTEWNPQQKLITGKLSDLATRYNDTVDILFDYDFGG